MLVVEYMSAASETDIPIAIADVVAQTQYFFSSKALLIRSFMSAVILIVIIPPGSVGEKAHLLRALAQLDPVVSAYASARRSSRACHSNPFDRPKSGPKSRQRQKANSISCSVCFWTACNQIFQWPAGLKLVEPI